MKIVFPFDEENRAMRRVAIAALVSCTVVLPTLLPAQASPAVKAPADRVVVMYFHRTQRCPTCRKMGSFSKEAVARRSTKKPADGAVEFHFIDFQDKKNAPLKKGYGVTGPSLVVAKVAKNKVVKHKNLKDIWKHVGDKAAFIKYVQGNVEEYLKGSNKTGTGASPLPSIK